MGFNLTGNEIKNTYPRLVTISGSIISNGTGSDISNLTVTASNATSASYALTASFAINAGVALNTGSLLVTASATGPITTFTKGDGSSFTTTVNNVANATSASFAVNAGAAINALTAISASFATNAATAATATSASFASTANTANSATTATSASYAATASFTLSVVSSSYAANADLLDGQDGTFYRNANNINAGTLNANRLSGTYTIDISGSAQTANSANTATSASYAATASIAQTALVVTSASYASFAEDANNLDGNDGTYYRNASNMSAGTLPTGRLSGSYTINISGSATTANSATSASFATTAANATSASYVQNADQLNGQTGAYYRNADNLNAGTVNVNRLSGTYNIDISGSAQTAQNAQTAISSSFASTAANATSASYALTASFALNAAGGGAFPYTGSAQVSGSLNVTGSYTALNGGYNIISASLSGSVVDNVGDVYTSSPRVEHIVTLTQTQYNAISASANANTFYLISDSTPVLTTNFALLSGSNNFIGNQTITGSVVVSGSLKARSLTAGNRGTNLFIGSGSGQDITSGQYNTLVGPAYFSDDDGAGHNLTTGGENVIIGANAGNAITTGGQNVFIGAVAARDNANGSENTVVGYGAGQSLGSSAAGNVMLGRWAGYNNSGNYNLLLGWKTGFNVGSGQSNIFIGPDVNGQSAASWNSSSFLAIGSDPTPQDNLLYGYHGSGTKFLNVKGNLTVSGSTTLSGSLTQNSGFVVLTQVSQSLNFADDTAAATGGVPLGGLYRNGNFIMIRLT